MRKQIPNWRNGILVDGRRAHGKGVRGVQLALKETHLVIVDIVNRAVCLWQRLFDALGDGLSDLARVAIGRAIENRDALLLFGGRLAPGAVLFHDLLHQAAAAKHRAMARADALDRQIGNLLHSRQHIRLKRPEDSVVIPLQRLLILPRVNDVVVKRVRLAVMGAKHIAGKQRLILLIPGKHGIRPVQEGCAVKAQLPPAQIDALPVFDKADLEVFPVGDILQVDRACAADENLCIGAETQKLGQRAAVVRLAVV